MKQTISFFSLILILITNQCNYQKKSPIISNFEPYSSLGEEMIFPEQGNLIKKIENTKKRKNIVTYYYANELIRKKILWKGKEDYQTILRGDAIIIHEKTKIQAPEIILDPDNNGIINGKILISESEQGIYFYADGGEYNRSEEYIKIKNNPYMRIKNNQDTILIETKEIVRNIAEKNIVFVDYVKMHGDDWVMFSDESIYYDDTKKFILKYHPVLLGKDLYLTAQTFVYKSDEQKIMIDQNPVILTNLNATKQNEDSNKKNETEIMHISSDLIEYNLKERSGIVKGNVLMQSKTKTIQGEEFLLKGKGIEKIVSEKNVTIVDKKENFFLKSNYMEYDLKNRKLYLKNQPHLITYDDITKENKTIKQELKAAIIERNFEKEITIAKGNIYFKRGNEIANSEYAIIDEKNETMKLIGNPILKRGDTEIHCKEINVYKDKIELQRELEAKIY
jgi:lipopolysaccharide export system protein LptA